MGFPTLSRRGEGGMRGLWKGGELASKCELPLASSEALAIEGSYGEAEAINQEFETVA